MFCTKWLGWQIMVILVIFDSIHSGEEYDERQRFYVWLEISAGFKTEECLM